MFLSMCTNAQTLESQTVPLDVTDACFDIFIILLINHPLINVFIYQILKIMNIMLHTLSLDLNNGLIKLHRYQLIRPNKNPIN